ncbi:hypothetical protein [Prevotella sp.]|uniref:hypothetical protein n=1 Tax=Prevotella sp. TaxID=59823 RepID=UPI0027E25036|nr:hypothetical protein [Prevotella sp.]
MDFIFSTLIVILIILLFTIFAAWIDKFNAKHKEAFIEKSIDKVSSLLTSKIAVVMEQFKVGPWYLVVYTQEANHPIWISNNNIRSVHPDLKNRKIIIKQFCNEDMVIENVENYELCSANEMCDYDM